ncbi:High potential iron-sulfur protein [Wenzhouxiangella sp. XN79A]|nr:High potential iron-sulfur protein [Wenzhouxiangella sp. XN79A]
MARQPAEPADSGDMPQVGLDDPTAQALGYKHDVANVDTRKYPQYRPGQVCANCTLYQGAEGEAWGGCQLFPGKLVNANGWCSGYTRKVG